QELITQHYAPVGAAARADLAAELDVLQVRSDPTLAVLAEKRRGQLADVEAFSAVYRRYTWDVAGVGDLRLAPFHLLASHNRVHSAEPHTWHLERLLPLAAADSQGIIAAPAMEVDLAHPSPDAAPAAWGLGLTERGAEGLA